MLTWKLNARDASLKLDRIISRLRRPRALFASWGLGIRNWNRESALSRSQGGKFWKGVAAMTRLVDVSDSGATVLCDHFAAAHKEYGGVIRPVKAKALTIPISPQAVGKRASEFVSGGRQLFVPKGTNLLGYSTGKNGKFKPLFVLVKSVDQKAEPWWIRMEQAAAMGEREGAWWLKRQVEG